MAGVGLSSRLEGGDHVQSVESEKVQGVLSRLVTLEPRDLCNEAIVEKCRATRDLRSCGRIVEHSLNSCNHASLCAECVQRCDVCPICRAPIRSFGTPVRTRLYEDCCRAGMIRSRPGGATDADGHPNADVRRLWSFFDIALEYGLVSVIHHYVSDVCMDDMAVSSNATVSLLLDGTVVKDWCRRTLSHIIWNLHEIYGLGSAQMRYKEAQMGRFSALLLGLSEVLESLEGPYVNESSAPIIELQQLIEATRRVSQHLDVMSWCARHNFLEDLQSSHSSISEWRLAVKNRKLAATDRAWHGNIQGVRTDTDVRTSTLFIEDAMSNAGFGEDDENAFIWETLELQHLRQTTTLSSWRREGVGVMSNLHASGMLYPPESVRAAVDLIFLEASSDLILAKKAIFLYYLFDRHWPGTNNDWKSILDDYVVTFGISRHAMLESFVFFLLDEADDSALEEACCLLPEVVSSTIHPKVPRVLLERKRPFAALDVLRCSDGIGDVRFSGSAKNDEVSQLEDAVTAVRVRLECGLLTDAYLYQRAYISRIKSIEPKQSVLKSTGMNQHGSRDWSYEMESLVEEICWLCAEKCLVAQMIELPWDKDEERVLLNCLMNLATKDPCSSTGSLMVMFYIMRCRNQEAYLVHKELLAIEKTFLEQCKDMERNEIIKNICVQRSLLVEKGVELLPRIQQEELHSGRLAQLLPFSEGQNIDFTSSNLSRIPTSQQLGLQPSAAPNSTCFDSKGDLAVTSEWGWINHEQPPMVHGKLTKNSSGPFKGFSLDVTTLQPGYTEGLVSPILGKKLLYNTDNGLTPFSTKSLKTMFTQNDKGDLYEDQKLFSSKLISTNVKDDKHSALSALNYVKADPTLLERNRMWSMDEMVTNGSSFSAENGPLIVMPPRLSENGSAESSPSVAVNTINSSSGDAKYRSRQQMLLASPNGKRKLRDHLDDFKQSVPSEDFVIPSSPKMTGNEQRNRALSSGSDLKSFYTKRKNAPRWRQRDSNLGSPSVLVSKWES